MGNYPLNGWVALVPKYSPDGANRSADLTTIPKPVLTSNEKTVKKSADQVKDSEKVSLTIGVTGTNNTQ